MSLGKLATSIADGLIILRDNLHTSDFADPCAP